MFRITSIFSPYPIYFVSFRFVSFRFANSNKNENRSHGTLVVLTHSPLSRDPKSFPNNSKWLDKKFKTRFSAKFPGGVGHINEVFRKRLHVFYFRSNNHFVQHGKGQLLRKRGVCRLTKNCRRSNFIDGTFLIFELNLVTVENILVA